MTFKIICDPAPINPEDEQYVHLPTRKGGIKKDSKVYKAWLQHKKKCGELAFSYDGFATRFYKFKGMPLKLLIEEPKPSTGKHGY